MHIYSSDKKKERIDAQKGIGDSNWKERLSPVMMLNELESRCSLSPEVAHHVHPRIQTIPVINTHTRTGWFV